MTEGNLTQRPPHLLESQVWLKKNCIKPPFVKLLCKCSYFQWALNVLWSPKHRIQSEGFEAITLYKISSHSLGLYVGCSSYVSSLRKFAREITGVCVKSIVANQQLGWLVSNYGFGKCIPGQRTTIAMVEASLWLNILDPQFNGRPTHNRLWFKTSIFLEFMISGTVKIMLEHHRSSTIHGVLFSMYAKLI